MDDKRKRLAPIDPLTGRTTDRVAEMSDEARAELARELAGRGKTVADAPFRRVAVVPDTPLRRSPEITDPAAAAAILRLEAELHRTERRLERVERSFTRSRYQTGSDAPPSGRYARLLSRAERLERQLRALR